MDPVSQITLGAAVGGCFRSRLGGAAPLVGAVCGGLPDLDVLASPAGEWAMTLYHRGPTHSLPILTLAAPLFGWLAWRLCRCGGFWTWTHLVFWAFITHALLDWCTPYGTQLFWPLTNRRFANDAVPVIDPVYTLPLLLAALIHGWPRVSVRFAQRMSVAALIVSTGYLALGYVQSRRALDHAAAAMRSGGFEPVEVRAVPTLLNIWVRRVIARDAAGSLRVGLTSTLAPRSFSFTELTLPDDPRVRVALDSEAGRIFRWFSMEMVAAGARENGDGTSSVRLTDHRYGLFRQPLASPFRAQADFDREGRLVHFVRLPRDADIDVRKELARLWELARGG